MFTVLIISCAANQLFRWNKASLKVSLNKI